MDTNQPAPPTLGKMLIDRGLLTEEELRDALRTHQETGTPLGDIVKERELVSPSQLADVLAVQRAWRPLGRMLVEQGLLNDDQLADCLDEQQRTGRRLGDIVRSRGIVSTPALDRVLAEQYQLELELERGFGAGLRGEIDRRHRLRRGQDDPGAEPASPPSGEAPRRKPLLARIDETIHRGSNDRVAALQQRLDARESTIEALGNALQRKDAELERLRAEILERDAIIHSLRRRLGEDESGQGATVHELRPPEHRLQH